jgi:hypothetical protein
VKRVTILLSLLAFTNLLIACNTQYERLGQQQALSIAWKTLEPNTSSHDINGWEVDEARKVVGGEVVNEFSIPAKENCPGPRPPENQPIKATSEYWYIKVLPVLPDANPQDDTGSPSPLPANHEPNIQTAIFLIDIYNGDVIARKLTCLDTP